MKKFSENKGVDKNFEIGLQSGNGYTIRFGSDTVSERIKKGDCLMNIVCLDMEGVLVPEIWVAFAEASGIPELKRTTRDEPD